MLRAPHRVPAGTAAPWELRIKAPPPPPTPRFPFCSLLPRLLGKGKPPAPRSLPAVLHRSAQLVFPKQDGWPEITSFLINFSVALVASCLVSGGLLGGEVLDSSSHAFLSLPRPGVHLYW